MSTSIDAFVHRHGLSFDWLRGLTAILALLASCLVGGAGKAGRPRRPSVLLLLADDKY